MTSRAAHCAAQSCDGVEANVGVIQAAASPGYQVPVVEVVPGVAPFEDLAPLLNRDAVRQWIRLGHGCSPFTGVRAAVARKGALCLPIVLVAGTHHHSSGDGWQQHESPAVRAIGNT